MGTLSRAFLAGSLGFAVAFVVACGSQNGLLTTNQSSTLNQQLDSVSSAVSAHNCDAATSAASEFGNQVAALPSNVNTTLVANLGQGAATISELAARDCSGTTTTTSDTTATTATTTTTTNSTPLTTTTVTSTVTNPTTTTTQTTTTATNPTTSGTSTTTNGGVGVGGTTGNGGAGG
jgi:hypothetical protein